MEIGVSIGFTLGVIAGLVIFFGVLLWVAARVLIPDTVIAIEDTNKPPQGISRSFELTQNTVLRVLLVLLAGFMVSLPVVTTTNYALQILTLVVPENSGIYIAVLLLSYVTSIVGNILLLPFWQALKGVLYYDLRSRREGLDLKLRHPKFQSDI